MRLQYTFFHIFFVIKKVTLKIHCCIFNVRVAKWRVGPTDIITATPLHQRCLEAAVQASSCSVNAHQSEIHKHTGICNSLANGNVRFVYGGY